jgi:hypothetical protein
MTPACEENDARCALKRRSSSQEGPNLIQCAFSLNWRNEGLEAVQRTREESQKLCIQTVQARVDEFFPSFRLFAGGRRMSAL